MNYAKNKRLAITRPKKPTLTDQAGAKDTDINVIIKQFTQHGQLPQGPEPMYGDFTNLPTDLRGFIDLGRSLKTNRDKLPAALKDMNVDALLALTPAQITTILTPPKEPAKEETK